MFKLSKSNFKNWKEEFNGDNPKKHLKNHLNDFIDKDSSNEDILYEILLRMGYPLTTKITPKKVATKTVYFIDDKLLICLERKITKELITEMAKFKPENVVCLDVGFGNNDQLQTNAKETFKNQGVIDFKTI